MKTKTAPAMTVLSCQMQTNMKSMLKDVGDLNKQIYGKAIESGFQPTGPQYWIYKWESMDPNANFELRITLPVATFGKELSCNTFRLSKEQDFKCLSVFHHGSYDKLKDSYALIVEYMENNQLQAGQVCREVYINCDFENAENCITEIQFGLQ